MNGPEHKKRCGIKNRLPSLSGTKSRRGGGNRPLQDTVRNNAPIVGALVLLAIATVGLTIAIEEMDNEADGDNLWQVYVYNQTKVEVTFDDQQISAGGNHRFMYTSPSSTYTKTAYIPSRDYIDFTINTRCTAAYVNWDGTNTIFKVTFNTSGSGAVNIYIIDKGAKTTPDAPTNLVQRF